VRATAGEASLGGDDFDQRIAAWLIAEFQRETGIDLKPDPIALGRLKEAAEKAKCELSTAQSTQIVLPFMGENASGAKNLETVLSRPHYEELIDDLLQRTTDLCKCCLADAHLRPGEIAEVLLLGGQTRDLKVIEAAWNVFGMEPNLAAYLNGGLATGAAIEAGIRQGTLKDLDTVRRTAPRARDAIRREMERHAWQHAETAQNEHPQWLANVAPAVAAFWRGVYARIVETGEGLWLQIGGESYDCRLVNVYVDEAVCLVEVLTRALVSGGEEGFLKAANTTFKVVVVGVGEESRSLSFAGPTELKGPRRWPVQAALRLLGADVEPDELPRPGQGSGASDTDQTPSGPEPVRLPPGQPLLSAFRTADPDNPIGEPSGC
jgi:hypothetical protein